MQSWQNHGRNKDQVHWDRSHSFLWKMVSGLILATFMFLGWLSLVMGTRLHYWMKKNSSSWKGDHCNWHLQNTWRSSWDQIICRASMFSIWWEKGRNRSGSCYLFLGSVLEWNCTWDIVHWYIGLCCCQELVEMERVEAKASQALLDVSYSESFFGSPWIAVDHCWRARTHPRPSRRYPLSNDILRGSRRLRQSLRRRTASSPTACLNFLHVGMYLHCTCFNYLLKYKVYKWMPILYMCVFN